MHASKVEFRGHDGSLLAARLDHPEGTPRAYALFAHCFTCGKDIHAATRVSAALCEMGIAVLRFDFTGLGMSEGDFANTNFSSNVADLVCAADYLRRDHQAPSLLVGHSLGGAAVIAAAGLIPEARAVATVGAPAEPSHVARQLGDAVDALRTADAVDVTLAGRPFRIKRQFLDDLHAQDMAEHLAHLGRALLVMHSPIDEIVDIDNARRIYAAARHPKSFVALDGARHLLGRREDAVYAARVLAAWVEHYLPPAGPAEATAG
ncbi:MAG: alpha/beta fold hydrolase [Xanthomonadaceae bacterium]|nr:alpha/beta fold hydrolase [Xanthomonadaceae bacterium]